MAAQTALKETEEANAAMRAVKLRVSALWCCGRWLMMADELGVEGGRESDQ